MKTIGLIGGMSWESTALYYRQINLAVPNLELQGVMDAESITEADLLAGKWDGAVFEIFEVNHADLTLGSMALGSGTIGDVSAGRVVFTAQLRAAEMAESGLDTRFE